jgi:uncharacterized membrane protein YfcA
LILGGFIAATAAVLAGVSGFGFALTATPLLLMMGFSLPFVVTVNLMITLATRLSVAYQFRRAIDGGRVAKLLAGCIPGLYIGALVLDTVDATTIRIGAGAIVMLAAVLLARGTRNPTRPMRSGLPLVAGALGGFLGTTTSMNGIPPVLLLARQRTPVRTFFADLAVYAVGSAALGLIVLAITAHLNGRAVAPAFVLWVPGALLGNFLGTSLALRISEARFRALVLGVAFLAGACSVATA